MTIDYLNEKSRITAPTRLLISWNFEYYTYIHNWSLQPFSQDY